VGFLVCFGGGGLVVFILSVVGGFVFFVYFCFVFLVLFLFYFVCLGGGGGFGLFLGVV